MKKTCLSLLVLFFVGCKDEPKAPQKELPAYSFAVPAGWGTERMPFPIEFAPQIPYKGVEELRFTPGWGNAKSDEYWAYSFLWWIEGNPSLNLAEDLKAYYTGLVGRNVSSRAIPPSKMIPVVTSFKNMGPDTYTGTVTMTDYMDLNFNPLTLNIMVHKIACGAHTAVIIGVSPKPYDHATWQSLNKLQEGFTCNN